MVTTTPEGATLVLESIWYTQGNGAVPLQHMSDEHIINARDMIARSTSRNRDYDYNGQQMEEFLGMTSIEHNIEVFNRELIRRNE